MEKIRELQTFDWKNNLTALQGRTRPTVYPLPYMEIGFCPTQNESHAPTGPPAPFSRPQFSRTVSISAEWGSAPCRQSWIPGSSDLGPGKLGWRKANTKVAIMGEDEGGGDYCIFNLSYCYCYCC